jgi:hypothetical protein
VRAAMSSTQASSLAFFVGAAAVSLTGLELLYDG